MLLSLLSLYSCHNTNDCKAFVGISDVMEYGYEVSKPSLLCLINDSRQSQTVCKNDFLTSDFVYYIVDDSPNTILGKMLNPPVYPVYIIFEKDSIVSVVCHEEMRKKVENSTGKLLKNELLNFGNNNRNYINYLNALLRLSMYLEKQDMNYTMELNYLDSLVRKQNKFYGKYLLAQLYKDLDVKNADEMYSDLWVNSTKNDMEEYPEEFIDIMKCKDHLVLVNKEDILFDYTEYDFGIISPNKEVTCNFSFTNNSSNKFIIHNVITTCGCTVPVWNRKPIAPNTRDSISVKFKSNYTGVSHKTIIIEGNCKQKIELKIRASICN